ncbi:MAG: hypothetical protein RBT19_10760 [Tenuifilaceae bacterium]|jgi:hypothetical protein|uniref:hypothetical protein n=1 Tax=Perlabentimonas gracilis TaxID=2715279 RepID=UPI00140DE8F4|nr:hypothetical protein [Perlabentimonas gracilis]MDX9770835.1 hypothetical protein [Tenuifilaceae bacterium]NHB70039.1 hypothetical protein [Perlabentimonas gracilis]
MSNKLIALITKIISWVIMGASIIVALVFFFRISGAEADMEVIIAAPYINWAIILLLIGAVLAVIFPLVHFILNPKNIAKVLVSLGVLAAVFLTAYLLSDTTPIVTATSALEPNFSDPAVLKLADTGIIATYILLGTALLALLFTGVRGIFNR